MISNQKIKRLCGFICSLTGAFLVLHLLFASQFPTWEKKQFPAAIDCFDRMPQMLFLYNNSLAQYMYSRGMFGHDKIMKKAKVLLYSSSQGVYGFQASLINKIVYPEKNAGMVANISTNWGEGIAFLQHIINENDLRDKIVVMGIGVHTLNDGSFSTFAKQAMRESLLMGYKTVFQTWFEYMRDSLVNRFLPLVQVKKEGGFQIVSQVAYPSLGQWRDIVYGDATDFQDPNKNIPFEAGDIAVKFDFAAMYSFAAALRKKNNSLVLVAMPSENFDQASVAALANALQCQYIPIEWDDLCGGWDIYHMDSKSRAVFSERLAHGLKALINRGSLRP